MLPFWISIYFSDAWYILDSLLSSCHSDSPLRSSDSSLPLLEFWIFSSSTFWMEIQAAKFPLDLCPFSFRQAVTWLFLHHQWPLTWWLCPFSSNINGHVTLTLGLQLSPCHWNTAETEEQEMCLLSKWAPEELEMWVCSRWLFPRIAVEAFSNLK